MSDTLKQALHLLTRREHGALELTNKLVEKGRSREEAKSAVAECQGSGLQSDARFAGALCRTRVQQGYGPERIRQELQAKGIADTFIQATFAEEAIDWLEKAHLVYNKKFKTQGTLSLPERQKQQRFLLYRGFSMTTIQQLFKHTIQEP